MLCFGERASVSASHPSGEKDEPRVGWNQSYRATKGGDVSEDFVLSLGREQEGNKDLRDDVRANDVGFEVREEVLWGETVQAARTEDDSCVDDDPFEGRGVLLEFESGILGKDRKAGFSVTGGNEVTIRGSLHRHSSRQSCPT